MQGLGSLAFICNSCSNFRYVRRQVHRHNLDHYLPSHLPGSEPNSRKHPLSKRRDEAGRLWSIKTRLAEESEALAYLLPVSQSPVGFGQPFFSELRWVLHLTISPLITYSYARDK